jgi:hypothetical protein
MVDRNKLPQRIPAAATLKKEIKVAEVNAQTEVEQREIKLLTDAIAYMSARVKKAEKDDPEWNDLIMLKRTIIEYKAKLKTLGTESKVIEEESEPAPQESVEADAESPVEEVSQE